MGSDTRLTRSASLFTLGVALRAALLAGIAFAVLKLLATQRLYMTAFLTTGIGSMLLVELARYVTRGERMLERFVEGLHAGCFDRPSPCSVQGFDRLRLALDRAAGALEAAHLQRQQQIHYLQTLIDNISVTLLVANEDGSVTAANPAARRLLGQAAGRLDELPAIGAGAAAILSQLPPGERAVVRCASGQRMLALCAQFSARGMTRRLLSLQSIEGELDAAELHAWQDVLRVLAHEIMNSLTPISSLAESIRPLMMRAHDCSSAQHARDIADAVEAIARRSAGLMTFVDRYRTLAELPPPVLRAVRVGDLIQRIGQLMSTTLAQKGIEYASCVEPPELTVQADRDLIEQVLVNLLHNAIDACSGAERPRIELSCQLRDEGIAISVADNGPGLDPSSIERIFIPLYTTKPGGSGIGLSLGRQIAHVHGGKLEAAAASPHGAIFTLLLPMRPASPCALRDAKQAPAQADDSWRQASA